jgi:hypothetical protein
MFRSIKTKIVSTPVEEVLEVVKADPVVQEPQIQVVANIEFIKFESNDGEIHLGTLIDYEGNEFPFQWDTKSNRIMRLAGMEVNKLVWDLCDEALRKYYIKPEPAKIEEPIGPKIEQAVNKALTPVATAFKNLEGKVDKALTTRPAPAPVQAAPAPRLQAVQSAPSGDTPAINVADNDISINAMRFLQETNVPDLGIDYMSL